VDPIVVVGAGLSGAVLAERFASVARRRVLVVEKRDHIGGNCFDYIDDNGILISKYGAHIFHTTDAEVWAYVNGFAEWLPYQHRVLSHVDGRLVPVPINIDTVNTLLGLDIGSEAEMLAWLDGQRPAGLVVRNSEDSALARFGSRTLYERMFKGYTYKQWERWPHELEPSVLERIPVRTNRDDRYFSDPFEGIPKHGYTALIAAMLADPLIEVRLGTDFFDVREELDGGMLFYTGPIDRFFAHRYEKLEYRSLRFELETHDTPSFQPAAVVNYPSLDVPYTRIVEFKKVYGSDGDQTTIAKEFGTWDGEPYYPVPSARNRAVYARYQRAAAAIADVQFVGRLANYKYLNMDQAIRNSLNAFQTAMGVQAPAT
jgi:UDP-galactopyranose mutase